MAYSIMPTLGEPQTCDGPCDHRDCNYWKRIVGKACVLCGEPVNSGERFRFGEGASKDEVVHTLCDEESWPTGDDAIACFAEQLAGRADTREWIEAEVARLRTKAEEAKADIARLEALIEQFESSPLRVEENRP